MESLTTQIIAFSVLAFLIGFLVSRVAPFKTRSFRLFSYFIFPLSFLIISFIITMSQNYFDSQMAGYIAGIWSIWYYIGTRLTRISKLEKFQNLKTIFGLLTIMMSLISLFSNGYNYDIQFIKDITKLLFGIGVTPIIETVSLV